MPKVQRLCDGPTTLPSLFNVSWRLRTVITAGVRIIYVVVEGVVCKMSGYSWDEPSRNVNLA